LLEGDTARPLASAKADKSSKERKAPVSEIKHFTKSARITSRSGDAVRMNAADFNPLDDAEKKHFHKCQKCGEMVDMRQLDDVVFEDHLHRPDIQYAGWERLSDFDQLRLF
jgi:hypothetical protein